MRCKLACVSILFASDLCGESRATDGARRVPAVAARTEQRGAMGVKRMRCKQACVSILFASDLCGDSRTTDGARRVPAVAARTEQRGRNKKGCAASMLA